MAVLCYLQTVLHCRQRCFFTHLFISVDTQPIRLCVNTIFSRVSFVVAWLRGHCLLIVTFFVGLLLHSAATKLWVHTQSLHQAKLCLHLRSPQPTRLGLELQPVWDLELSQCEQRAMHVASLTWFMGLTSLQGYDVCCCVGFGARPVWRIECGIVCENECGICEAWRHN